jgi:hypothetical protein
MSKQSAVVSYAVKDVVAVKGKEHLMYYGTIKEFISEDRVIVRFKEPREPRNGLCEKCGWPGSLSVDGSTREVVHMQTGCGHGHGFRAWEEVVLRTALLENITQKRKREKSEKAKKDAKRAIQLLGLPNASKESIKRLIDEEFDQNI